MADKFVQTDFSGGINLFQLDNKLAENEYGAAYNIRTRDNAVSCVRAPVRDSAAPKGRKQGLYGLDKYLLLVNNGRVWWKDCTDSTSAWALIPNVVLSPTASRVYAQVLPAVPASYLRKLKAAEEINSTGTGSANTVAQSTQFMVQGVPASILLQDGTTQPWCVYIDALVGGPVGRQIQKYSKWTSKTREYVPVGKQMAIMDGILFVLSSDGKSIYRSVSNSYLDFVVNVDAKGDKGGDASTTAYSCTGNTMTAILPLSSGELLVGTLDGCRILELNYDRTIFQEPTFYNRKPLGVGLVNQFSFCDILGDYAFVDPEGLRSFNAVSQLNSEGRNEIFSLKIARLFDGLNQSDGAAIVFDNYALFSVESQAGPVVLVYDQLRKSWVSIDSYGITAIRQFATVKQATDPTLWAITDEEVYELFKGDPLEAAVFFRAVSYQDAQEELRLEAVRPVFVDVLEDVVVSVSEFTNGFVGATIRNTLYGDGSFIPIPTVYPVAFVNGTALQNINCSFQGQARNGFKVAPMITWSSSARLFMLQIDVQKVNPMTSFNLQAKIFNS